MITQPPCIPRLVGCSDTDVYVPIDVSSTNASASSNGSVASGRSSSASAFNIFSGGSSSFGAIAADRAGGTKAYGSGTLIAGTDQGFKPTTGYKPVPGFKPYTNVPLPRTGASDHLYASLIDDSFTLVPVQGKPQSFSIVSIFLLSSCSIFLMIIVMKKGLKRL